jgi:hypothetical protein
MNRGVPAFDGLHRDVVAFPLPHPARNVAQRPLVLFSFKNNR